MNRNNPAIKRILADVKELKSHPSTRYYAQPLEVISIYIIYYYIRWLFRWYLHICKEWCYWYEVNTIKWQSQWSIWIFVIMFIILFTNIPLLLYVYIRTICLSGILLSVVLLIVTSKEASIMAASYLHRTIPSSHPTLCS